MFALSTQAFGIFFQIKKNIGPNHENVEWLPWKKWDIYQKDIDKLSRNIEIYKCDLKWLYI